MRNFSSLTFLVICTTCVVFLSSCGRRAKEPIDSTGLEFNPCSSNQCTSVTPPESNEVEDPFINLQNPNNPCDIDGDGNVNPTDSIKIINYLYDHPSTPTEKPYFDENSYYFDVNGDGYVSQDDIKLFVEEFGKAIKTICK